jgi:starvation-inducible outer membrane lipoprotein
MNMLKSLALAACLALTLAACATAPQPPVANAQKPATGCVPATATRLPTKDSECSGFGASYGAKELQSTGQPFANQSLQMLDPSVSTNGAH